MQILIFCLLLFLPQTISSVFPGSRLVIWNVQQGSWTTLITPNQCLHIDSGGHWPNHFPTHCLLKRNALLFTHYDWDHMSLSRKIFLSANKTCRLQDLPISLAANKKLFFKKIKQCSSDTPQLYQQIYRSTFRNENESSAFLIKGLLVTGDSPQAIEKRWLSAPALVSAKFLLAGHHGSRTSTSVDLLNKMPNLKMILVSAFKKKYGHPHRETVIKAERFHLPVITTEDYGSVAIEVND